MLFLLEKVQKKVSAVTDPSARENVVWDVLQAIFDHYSQAEIKANLECRTKKNFAHSFQSKSNTQRMLFLDNRITKSLSCRYRQNPIRNLHSTMDRASPKS